VRTLLVTPNRGPRKSRPGPVTHWPGSLHAPTGGWPSSAGTGRVRGVSRPEANERALQELAEHQARRRDGRRW